MLKLENSIRGLSFSRVAFDLTIQEIINKFLHKYMNIYNYNICKSKIMYILDVHKMYTQKRQIV